MPVFVTVRSCEPLVLPTSTLAKSIGVGVLIRGAGASAGDGIVTLGVMGSLVVRTRSMAVVAGAVGANDTVKLVCAPGATLQLVVAQPAERVDRRVSGSSPR